jgi:hypothetical protein
MPETKKGPRWSVLALPEKGITIPCDDTDCKCYDGRPHFHETAKPEPVSRTKTAEQRECYCGELLPGKKCLVCELAALREQLRLETAVTKLAEAARDEMFRDNQVLVAKLAESERIAEGLARELEVYAHTDHWSKCSVVEGDHRPHFTGPYANGWIGAESVLARYQAQKGEPFQCFLCGKWFIGDGVECCVGGHWTPHHSNDRPEGNYFVTCCHKYQTEVPKP